MVFLSSSKLRKDSEATWGFPQRSVSSSTSSSNLIHRAVSFHCISWFLSIVSSFSSTNTWSQHHKGTGAGEIKSIQTVHIKTTCMFNVPLCVKSVIQWCILHVNIRKTDYMLNGLPSDLFKFSQNRKDTVNIVHVITLDVQLRKGCIKTQKNSQWHLKKLNTNYGQWRP